MFLNFRFQRTGKIDRIFLIEGVLWFQGQLDGLVLDRRELIVYAISGDTFEIIWKIYDTDNICQNPVTTVGYDVYVLTSAFYCFESV